MFRCHGVVSTLLASRTFSSVAAPAAFSHSFSMIADLDKQSRHSTKDYVYFTSLQQGSLIGNATGGFSVEFARPRRIETSFASGGRGMELSELVAHEERLFTVCDRTGIVFEISPGDELLPRYILLEGEGSLGKGFKAEWATMKGSDMWVGSIGMEWFTPDNEVIHRHNMFVKSISNKGEVTSHDWQDVYSRLRDHLGASYLYHEAVRWSPVHKRWFFLPRRECKSRYDEVNDETQGTNVLLSCDDNLQDIRTECRIGQKMALRGFSSFSFVPGSGDELILGLLSEEQAATGHQASFVRVFDLAGNVLMDDVQVPESYKFEGVEFLERSSVL